MPQDNLALTPHPGEMSRLLGCKIPEVQADRLGAGAESGQPIGTRS